jgi:hypothetical protein
MGIFVEGVLVSILHIYCAAQKSGKKWKRQRGANDNSEAILALERRIEATTNLSYHDL